MAPWIVYFVPSTITSSSSAVVDERQKSKIEKRKRNLKSISPISRGEREIWISFPHFREEKEKSEFYFHTFERRKRNLNFISPVSRGEREIWISYPHFREEKEKSDKYYQLSRKEREIPKVCLDQKGMVLIHFWPFGCTDIWWTKNSFQDKFYTIASTDHHMQFLDGFVIFQGYSPKRDGENFTLEISPKMKWKSPNIYRKFW